MQKNKQAKPVLVIRVPVEIVQDIANRHSLEVALRKISDELSAEYYTFLLVDSSVSRIEFEAHNANASEISLRKLEERLLTDFKKTVDA